MRFFSQTRARLVARVVSAFSLATVLFVGFALFAANAGAAAPVVVISSPVAGSTETSAPFDLHFTVNGVATGAECRLDKRIWTGCVGGASSSFPVEYIANGPHTLEVRANVAGETGTAATSFTLNDTTAPAFTPLLPTDGGTYSDANAVPIPGVVFPLTETIDISCKIDNSRFHTCYDFAFSGIWAYGTNGGHTATVRGVDAAGNVTTYVSHYTVDDTSAPTIGVAPADATVFTDRVRFTLTVANPYDRVFARIDDRGEERVQTNTSPLVWAPADVASGAHTVTFRIVDPAGNQNTTTRGFTASDTTAPTITVNSPTPGQTYADDSGVADFSVDDPDAIVTCSIDGLTAQRCVPGGFPLRWAGIGNGAHTLIVKATDNAGNTQSLTRGFSISDVVNGGPGLSLAVPAAGATYTAQPVIHYTIDPSITARSVSCRLDGVQVNQYSCRNGAGLDATSNGSHTFTLRVISNTGERYEASSSFVLNDVTAPVTNILAPAAGDVYTDSSDFNSSMFSLNVIDPDADGINRPNGQTSRCSIDGAATTPCNNYYFPISLRQFLGNGAHTLTVYTQDWIGNSTSQTVGFTIDDQAAPVVTITNPAPNTTIAAGVPAVDFVVNDPRASMQCTIDGVTAADCTADRNSRGSFFPGALSQGAHTVTVTATDQAGNAGQQSVNFTIADSTAPAMAIQSPVGGSTVSGNVTAHFTSNEPLANVECAVDANAYSTTGCALDLRDRLVDVTAQRMGQFSPPTIDAGAHLLAVKGTDFAGNSGVASVTINVSDTTGPRIIFTGASGSWQTYFADAPTVIGFTTDDPTADFECKLDAGPYAACGFSADPTPSGRFSLPPLATGSYTATVLGTDPAGNTTEVSTSITINDTTPPWIGFNLSVGEVLNGVTVVSPAEFGLYVDGAVDPQCAIDSAPFSSCNISDEEIWTAIFPTTGPHEIHVCATDASGNSSSKTLRVFVASGAAAPIGESGESGPACPAGPAGPAGGGNTGGESGGNSIGSPGGFTDNGPVTTRGVLSPLRPRISKGMISLPVVWKLTLPTGIQLDKACTGNARATVLRGRKKLRSAQLPLRARAGDCVIAGTLKFPANKLGRKKVVLRLRFAGNSQLKATSLTKSFRIRRR